jgi:hypothetical protein
MRLLICLLCGVLLAGCASVNSHEKHAYRELKTEGAPCEKVAEPAAAALLNILPGGGDIYLATGDGANHWNWGAFVLDLATWPISPLWAIPQGAVTADTVNKKECVAFYTTTTIGRAKRIQLKKEQAVKLAELEKL